RFVQGGADPGRAPGSHGVAYTQQPGRRDGLQGGQRPDPCRAAEQPALRYGLDASRRLLTGRSHVNHKESCMKHVLKNERGMALALAIVALVIVGALIAGALFSGTQEQRVAENVRRVQASFGVAEEGVYDIIRGWSDPTTKTRYANLYPYPAFPTAHDTVQFGKKTAKSKTGSYNGTMFKLNDQLYLIDMTAQDTMSLAGRIRGGGASQRLGLLTRIRPLQVHTQAAFTSGGSDVAVGSASIDGNDHQPTGWAGCPPLDSAKAGIRTQSDGTVA